MTVQTEFQQQILSHQKYLNQLAFKLTKSKGAAEDLTQETNIKLLQNEDKFQMGTNFKAWSSVILRNLFINDYRKIEIRAKRMNNLRKTNARKTNENEGVNKLYLEELEQVIKNLSDTLKIPFILFYQGYAYYEISQHLDIPIGTVKSRIFMARQLLRKNLRTN